MESNIQPYMTDISFDLETLSTAADAAILSIGATSFDRHTGVIGQTFYEEIMIDDALKHGSVSAGTLAWWVAQADSAKRLFSSVDEHPKIPLAAALQRLSVFVEAAAYSSDVWGNGATFDISILENAYARCGIEVPWKFYNIRDLRTLVDMASHVRDFNKGDIEFVGTPHHAGDDAAHQAKIAIAAMQALAPPRVSALAAG